MAWPARMAYPFDKKWRQEKNRTTKYSSTNKLRNKNLKESE